MNIHINGKGYSLPTDKENSISDAITLHLIEPQQSTFAVALNGNFIGKESYQKTLVNDGDSVDILQPIQGG